LGGGQLPSGGLGSPQMGCPLACAAVLPSMLRGAGWKLDSSAAEAATAAGPGLSWVWAAAAVGRVPRGGEVLPPPDAVWCGVDAVPSLGGAMPPAAASPLGGGGGCGSWAAGA
jgi:hypothetical protein